MNGSATVAVTGASGFVGRHLTAELQRCGHTARPLLRRASPDIETGVAIGDLTSAQGLRAALAGVDCVVHCAGLAHVALHGPAEEKRAMQINADATRSVATAAVAAGVKHLIFLSSAKVMGECSGLRPWLETDAVAPSDPYARSKAAAEAALTQVAAESSLAVTVLRPPLVYGPGVRADFLRLLALADTPWPLPLASVAARRSMVYVGNLVDAVIACIGQREAMGHTFFVTDGEDLAVAELVGALRTHLGRPARLVPCPVGLLELAARAAGQSSELQKLVQPFACHSERLRAALDWTPPFSVAEALRFTANWYRHQGRSRATEVG